MSRDKTEQDGKDVYINVKRRCGRNTVHCQWSVDLVWEAFSTNKVYKQIHIFRNKVGIIKIRINEKRMSIYIL